MLSASIFEKLLAQIVQVSEDNICVLNTQGLIVFVNDAWEVFGRQNGSSCTNWINKDYLASFDNAICSGDLIAKQMKSGIIAVLQGKTSQYSVEYPCHSPSELRFFVLRVVKLTLDTDSYFLVVHKRLMANQEFIEQKARLDIATSAGQIGIWEFDLCTNELVWNEWMYKIYGISTSQKPIHYGDWYDKVHPEDKECAKTAVLDAISKKQTFEYEFRIIPKEGNVTYISARANVITDNYGTPTKMIGVNLDVTHRHVATNKIKTLAYVDPVTNLPNRRAFSEYLTKARMNAQQDSLYYALLFLDVDNFKRINDSLGHTSGDEYLSCVAQKLKQQTRASDFVARIGGDEFVVVLTQLAENKSDAEHKSIQLAQTILAALNDRVLVFSKECQCSISVGVTLFNGLELNSDEILREADLAMYKAKRTNKGCVGMFDASLKAKIEREVTLEQGVREGLANNQFSLHYQPQIDFNKKVVGCEVLIRWTHPKLGNISPAEFIPIAEESNLIIDIGRWVFKRVFKQISLWQRHNLPQEFKFAINVSVRQFLDVNFTAELLALVEQFEVNPASIRLELTETMLIEDIESTIAKMNDLANKGFQFSIDDFGTGYSSLSYLRQLPINELKIDRSFVIDLLENDAAQSIVSAIISMSDSLGFSTIAEGVETLEHFKMLDQLGCYSFQGFLFSRPLDATAFISFVKNHEHNKNMPQSFDNSIAVSDFNRSSK